MILDTCHCIKPQDEEGHEDSLCCEQADGQGEDQTDVVVGHGDHLDLEIGNCNYFDMISSGRIQEA